MRAGARAVLLVLVLGAVLPAPAPRAAEDEGEVDLEAIEADRRAKASLYPVGRRISRYLSAAAEEVEEEKPDEAERLLLKLNPKRLNPYERALVNRMLAFVAYGAERPEAAIGYFEKVLAEEALPLRDENRIRFNIAQLYAGAEKWSGVIEWVNRWLRYTEDPDPLGYYLMGIAYYQLEDFDAAIDSTRKAIAAAPPREPWLRLLAALYAQKEDFASAAPVLEELVLRFPKKQYWVQLSLIYGAREDYETSLAVQQMAYTQGFLTEDAEVRRLARTYLFRDLPYYAAKVLAKGVEDGTIEADSEAYELLANSWIAAREYERSLPPLEKAAALSKDGRLYVRLGQVLMQREQWDRAAEMLHHAVQKGGLPNPGNAQLLLGIAYYNSGRPADARSYFTRARDHAETREPAERWITHLATEAGETAEAGAETAPEGSGETS